MQNHNIQAIFFDFGGVILRTADGVDHAAIEAEWGLEAKTLLRCVYAESRWGEYQIGGCTLDEWNDSILAAMAKRVGERAEELLRAFQDAPRPLNDDVVALIRRLHGHYKLGILSNTIPGMEARLRERLDFVDLFDLIVGSGDIGMAKPDPGIYLLTAKEAGVAPEACVFTDDRAEHAEAARGVGMHGFHFTGYEQFVADLRSVGVEA